MNIIKALTTSGFLTLLSATSFAAELLLSTENTTSHFQTLHLQAYALTLEAEVSEHSFTVVHSAEAFKDRDVAEAVSAGRVAIAAPGVWHLGRFASDLNALLLPAFMGLGSNDVRTLVDSRFGTSLNQSLEEKLNVKVLGKWLDLGPAHIFTREREIKSFADLKGLRIRYPGGEGNALRLKALGAEPVLIPWPNVPEALDRGEIDGLLTTASTIASASLWDHGIRHAFLSHSYYPFYVPMISRNIWNRLSPETQDQVANRWEFLIEDGRKMAVAHQAKSIESLMANNITVVTPSPAARAKARQLLLGKQVEIAERTGISPSTLSALNAIAEP